MTQDESLDPPDDVFCSAGGDAAELDCGQERGCPLRFSRRCSSALSASFRPFLLQSVHYART